MPNGLIIAAPSSGSGKTTITLGLLRALKRRGIEVASAKVGPDYIDPAFHAAATGKPCPNLDSWAMRPATLLSALQNTAPLTVIEGVMGLFDGALLGPGVDPLGTGSTASIARITGWPVLLVVDAARQAQSVAALVSGFARHDPAVRLAGVILNKVASDRHAAMLRGALAAAGHPVLGAVRADTQIARPSRHLGLVQAGEHPDLEGFLDQAAERMARDLDIEAILAASEAATVTLPSSPALSIPPLGRRIAVASDAAFAFSYPHILTGWRAAGTELSFFSPLADECPAEDADAIFLPGGYPELHGGRLAAARSFASGMRDAAKAGTVIYGECGGYMVLGQGLIDSNGTRHEMLGLLPHETSFAAPLRHLGYRQAELLGPTALGTPGSRWRGHEFHYASETHPAGADPLFRIRDAAGDALGAIGGRAGAVSGSFLHLIDRAD